VQLLKEAVQINLGKYIAHPSQQFGISIETAHKIMSQTEYTVDFLQGMDLSESYSLLQ